MYNHTKYKGKVYFSGYKGKVYFSGQPLSYIPQFYFNDNYLVFIDTFPLNAKNNDTQLNYYTITFSNSTYVSTFSFGKKISSVQLYNEHFVKVLEHNLYTSYSYTLALTAEGKFRVYSTTLNLIQTFVLSDIIIESGGEIINQQFVDFNFVQTPTYSSYTATIDLLFSSQSLNYKFQLVYDSYNAKVISFKYNYALSRYLDAENLFGLFIDRQLLQAAIPYRYKNQLVISVYQLPNNSVSDQRIVYSYGGISQYHDFSNPNKVAFSIYKNILAVGLTQDYLGKQFTLSYYQVDLRYIIQVDDQNGKLYEQEVALEISNDLCSEPLLFQIQIISNEFQDQQDNLNSIETNKRIQ